MAKYLKFHIGKNDKKYSEKYTNRITDKNPDNKARFYRFIIPLPINISKSGYGYVFYGDDQLHQSNYDKSIDYIPYNDENFEKPSKSVRVVSSYRPDGSEIYETIRMSPFHINQCAKGYVKEFARSRYEEMRKSVNHEQLVDNSVAYEPAQVVQNLVNINVGASHDATLDELGALSVQSRTKFTVTDKSETTNQERKFQRLHDIQTKFGTEEAVTPSNGANVYANLEEMNKSIKQIAADNVKEFDKVIESYSKLTEWAQQNNATLSFKTSPVAPAISTDPAITMKAYATEIKKWRKEFSDEITSLKEQGYDVPDDLYKMPKTYGSKNHYVAMAEFNSARGVTPYNENGLLVNSSTRGTYMASVCGKYGLSENETKMLESGESVVFTDIPDSSSSSKLRTYVGKLRPITATTKKHLGKVTFDGYTANDFTHEIALEEIRKTDPRFADVEHNERYRMNKEFYDRDLSRTAIERKAKTTPTRHVNMPETKAASLPTMKLRGNTITHGKFDENSLERRLRSYHKLRTQPATETGKKLGFETAWDEKRFFDSFTALQMLSGGSGIRSNKQKVKLLERAANNNFEGIAVDTANTKILNSFDKPWKEMMEQAKLRQTEPSPAGAAKGLVSAWEEKIVEDYEKLTNSTYDRTMPTEDVRRIFTRYYRLEETLEIRKTGQLISEQDVGTDKDKYAQLSVSGFYKYASDNGITKGYKNRREERIAESLPVEHLVDDLDDIPDFT